MKDEIYESNKSVGHGVFENMEKHSYAQWLSERKKETDEKETDEKEEDNDGVDDEKNEEIKK